MRTARILAFVVLSLAGAARADWWQDTKDMLAYKYERSQDAFSHGRDDYYASGVIWHAPWAYSSERRHDELNDAAWGGGFGRSAVDGNGNTHSLYAIAFRDSHYKPQYTAGYMWITYWPLAGRLEGGLGYSVFIFCRDEVDYFPLPGLLPAASLRYRGVEFVGTYIPGLAPAGSVGYFFARFNF